MIKRPRNNDGGDSEESDEDLFKDEEETPIEPLKSDLVKQEIEPSRPLILKQELSSKLEP
jgi:hypothetical protein